MNVTGQMYLPVDDAPPVDLTCPHCGAREPNDFLLSINHGIDRHRTSSPSGFCTAQTCLRGHVLHAARALAAGAGPLHIDGKKVELRSWLDDRIARALELGIDPAWIEQTISGTLAGAS